MTEAPTGDDDVFGVGFNCNGVRLASYASPKWSISVDEGATTIKAPGALVRSVYDAEAYARALHCAGHAARFNARQLAIRRFVTVADFPARVVLPWIARLRDENNAVTASHHGKHIGAVLHPDGYFIGVTFGSRGARGLFVHTGFDAWDRDRAWLPAYLFSGESTKAHTVVTELLIDTLAAEGGELCEHWNAHTSMVFHFKQPFAAWFTTKFNGR